MKFKKKETFFDLSTFAVRDWQMNTRKEIGKIRNESTYTFKTYFKIFFSF